MKRLGLGIIAAVVCLRVFAVETDPRIQQKLDVELRQTERLCFSFARDGGQSGITITQACDHFAIARYQGNTLIANHDPQTDVGVENVFQAQTQFCSSLGGYAQPSNLGVDCEAWNRARKDLTVAGTTPSTPAGNLSAQIDAAERTRQQFCQSLLAAGNPGNSSVFAERVSACFAMVKLATDSDRALFLGDF